MTTTRRVAASVAALSLFIFTLCALPTMAGAPDVRTFVIFNGETRAAQDTSEYASVWFPVKGAYHISLKIISSSAAADTATVDSITTFKLLYSDSVSRIVTPFGITRLSAADSVMVDATAAVPVDTAFGGTGRVALALPINKPLKSPGRVVEIYPHTPSTSAIDAGSRAVIGREWMRVRCLPLIRMTTAGFSSTAGIRTSGVNKLKITATVYYQVR